MKAHHRILLCEDDEGIVEAITLVLENEGHVVTTLTDENEILSFCRKNNPDLVLLDIWMPKVDGKTLAQKIKSYNETRHIPILMLSADNQVVKISQELLVDGYLKKPFNLDDLLSAVNKYATQNIGMMGDILE